MKTTRQAQPGTIGGRTWADLATILALSVLSLSALGGGFLGFRTWMVERLADWDAWRPHTRRELGLGTPWPRPPRFEPRASQTRPGTAEPGSRHSSRRVEDRDWMATASDASIELRLALELCRYSGVDGRGSVSPSSSARPQPELASRDPVDDLFEENPDGYEPAEEDRAPSASSSPLATMSGPRIAPTRVVDQHASPVTGEARWNDDLRFCTLAVGRQLRRVRHTPPMITETRHSGEGRNPIAPSTSRSDIAYHSHPPARTAAMDHSRHDDLGRAIALTRDAARAWMDVLAGTTSVRVTSR